jgi:hypothetical protein
MPDPMACLYCDSGDFAAIQRVGWGPVVDALRSWARHLGGAELAPYAFVLAEVPPEEIVAAVYSLLGNEYPPSASEVFRRVDARRHPEVVEPERSGPQKRKDQRPRALDACRVAFSMGAPECSCPGRAVSWEIDLDGVLRCPGCGGLEPGQIDDAIEGTDLAPEPLATLDIPAHLRRLMPDA